MEGRTGHQRSRQGHPFYKNFFYAFLAFFYFSKLFRRRDFKMNNQVFGFMFFQFTSE